jgi:hypothetical protein
MLNEKLMFEFWNRNLEGVSHSICCFPADVFFKWSTFTQPKWFSMISGGANVAGNYSACVLASEYCGSLSVNFKDILPFSHPNLDCTKHCQSLKIQVTELSEADLIQNRIGQKYESAEPICPKHRFKFELYWKPSKICGNSNHISANGQKKLLFLQKMTWF